MRVRLRTTGSPAKPNTHTHMSGSAALTANKRCSFIYLFGLSPPTPRPALYSSDIFWASGAVWLRGRSCRCWDEKQSRLDPFDPWILAHSLQKIQRTAERAPVTGRGWGERDMHKASLPPSNQRLGEAIVPSNIYCFADSSRNHTLKTEIKQTHQQ